MLFKIDTTELEELKDTINKTLSVCKKLNDKSSINFTLLESMKLSKEQEKILIRIFEE